jgi:hypothetical protein
MKRSFIQKKPAKVKVPSVNHPDRAALPPSKPVAASGAKKRARIKPRSSKGKEDDAALARHVARFPDIIRDPFTGDLLAKNLAEFHHPAGRRKASFLFVIPVSPETHRRIHDNPKWATLVGMLWSGRNSKVFTESDAWKLLELCPFPQPMRLAIELWVASNDKILP